MVTDYNLSVLDVYRSATLRLLHNDLEMLAYAGSHLRRQEWPSWIRDWRIKKNTNTLQRFNCWIPGSFFSEVCMSPKDMNVLMVSGVPISSVRTTWPVQRHGHGESRYLNLERFREYFGDSGNASIVSLEMLCRVIFARVFDEYYSPSPKPSHASFERSILELQQLVQKQSSLSIEVPTGPSSPFCETHRPCHERALFLSEHNQLGVGPKNSKPGDVVFLLLGWSNPFVLRPVRRPDGTVYQLVGECYLDGHAHDEAVLGPLPSGYEAMMYSPSRPLEEYTQAYYNTTTGDIQRLDPRILPHRSKFTEAEWNMYENEYRLTADMARKIGAPLQNISL
ncbi:hypothetical protein EJ05DRAFT_478640, partial [Pseudovirgaria hyperparasitica]